MTKWFALVLAFLLAGAAPAYAQAAFLQGQKVKPAK